jgi:hypothetical protein
LNGDRDEKC